MSLSHLIQLNNNPDSLKDILVSKGLSMREQPIEKWQKLDSSANDFAYCSGQVVKMNLQVYSIFSETDFYSILFPKYTTNQIKQLQCLLALVKSIFKEKNHSTYQHRNTFMFAKGCVSATTHEISFSYRRQVLYLQSYASMKMGDSLQLADLAFDTVYTVILNDFNDKVKLMSDAENSTINTAFLISLQHETNEEFIDRMHNSNIANLVPVEDFNSYVEKLNLEFLTDGYEPNTKVSDNKSIYCVEKLGKKTYIIGIQKINTLKTLLKPLIKENNLEKLINLFSIARFYSSVLYPSYDNNVIDFVHLEVLNLSKEQLSKNPDYFEISIGLFDINIGEKLKISNFEDGDEHIFSTVDEAYDHLFKFIQNKICLHLNTEPSKIINEDILVLSMMTF